ncbi:MAG: AAA family ATPase [Flexibacter sp. CG_4_10_14_3_um_filter_32_15]|nr:MAG: AAA family ATPase [Flexibacter sp. CG_4_10_14_3_um_filter_32_15]
MLTQTSQNPPLAERMRPTSLEEVIGQKHLIGNLSKNEGVLARVISSGAVPSMILWGAPGIGKTTLALLIAKALKRPFHTLSAISAGVKDVREVIETAKRQTRAILFIDEIHRFSKSQQDALLGAVERGTITLIGATTENPSFEINSALLSRCQVYILNPLSEEELKQLLGQAMEKDFKLKKKNIEIKSYEALFRISGGDARKLLNLFELVVESEPNFNIVNSENTKENKIEVTDEKVMQSAQQRISSYDKSGENHYDIVSAFIKSIRGSDPNAAIYWLARMIEGGEDVKFIARRLVILASEDIGNANPTALVLATTTFQAAIQIGFPEAQIVLAQCVTYLATSPKSNSSYMAIKTARKIVQEQGDLPVPLHLRNAPTKLMKQQGYGKDYNYSHNNANNFAQQEYFPKELAGTKLYEPAQNARENEIRRFLKERWKEKYGY